MADSPRLRQLQEFLADSPDDPELRYAVAMELLSAVHETVEPPALIGCVAQGVVAGSHEFEDDDAVAVWLASGLAAETFQLDFVRAGAGGLLAGYRFDRAAHDLYLMLPDPYTFPSSLLIEHLNSASIAFNGNSLTTAEGQTMAERRYFEERARARP